MSTPSTSRLFLLATFVALSVLPVPGSANPPQSDSAEILVLAASSLTDPMRTVVRRWEESGRSVDVSFAGSSTLAAQIERGIRADVFLSANRDWVDYLAERDLLVDATRDRKSVV